MLLCFPKFFNEIFKNIIIAYKLQPIFRVRQLLVHLSGVKQVECPFCINM